jgi:hypothetical protein
MYPPGDFLNSLVGSGADIQMEFAGNRMSGIIGGALEEIGPIFEGVYSKIGISSIHLEMLKNRFFAGLKTDDRIWDGTLCGKNRDRILVGEVNTDRKIQRVRFS